MKLIQSKDVPGLIKDGDMLVLPGITNCYAEEAMQQVADSFKATGHPAHLKLYWMAAPGILGGTRGMSSLCQDGLFDLAYCGHISGCGVPMTEYCRDNKAEFYNVPLGVAIQLMRATATHTPGVITKIGLKTYMDPRVDCARMNKVATKSLVELLTIDGEEWLLYKAPKHVNVVCIRGTYIDEDGNITIENEAYKNSYLAAAAAAKATGGIVIAQAERLVKKDTMKPKSVEIPGILIDYAYIADPYYHMQTGDTQYNPCFAGDIRIPLGDTIKRLPLGAKKIICRRAAMEIKPGDIVNLGVGTPEFVSSICAEEGCPDLFTLTAESGAIGGLPGSAHDFGAAYNASATIECEDMMMIYDGGTLDDGFLGFLQVGEDGNINSSCRNGLGIGIGGFMNVAGGAKKICFIAAMTAGSKGNQPEYEIGGGKLTIKKEGNVKKFIKKVDQISFNASVSVEEGKQVYYITERAVFQYTKQGLTLIEIAPGVDLQKDILDQMEFTPIIADDLKLMPAELFEEKWGGLAEYCKNLK